MVEDYLDAFQALVSNASYIDPDWSWSHPRCTPSLQWSKRSWIPSLRRTCTWDVFDPLNPLWPLWCSSSRRKTVPFDWSRVIEPLIPWWLRINILSPWSPSLSLNSAEPSTSPSLTFTGASTMSASSLETSGRLPSIPTEGCSNLW